MKVHRYIYGFSLFFFLTASLPGVAKTVRTEIDGLWRKYNATNVASRRIDILTLLGEQYILLDSVPKKDQLFDLAIQTALLDDTLLFNSYDKYFKYELDYLSEYLTEAKALAFANEMLTLAHNVNSNEWLYRAYANLAKAYAIAGNIELANDNVNKAYYYVSQLNNDRLRAECMLVLGYCKEKANKKIEAFRSYTDALLLSEKIGNEELKIDCYQRLSAFYYFLKKYEKGKYYKKAQIKMLSGHKSVDSNRLMLLNIDFANILFHNHEGDQGEKITQSVIHYAKLHGAEYINGMAFVLYRSYLVDNGLFGKLRDLYEKQYPEEIHKIASQDTILYYRLNGYIFEAKGKADSAQVFYQMAENRLLASKKRGIPLANFYKRYGEFLVRRDNISGAIQKFDSAYKFAASADYFPYLIDVTHYLDSLSYLQKNVDKAYQFALLNKKYAESQASVNKGEEMLQLEVENEARQQELRAEMERSETERQHNIQYTFMVVAIIGVFILLTILGSFKVHPGMIRALGFFSFIFFFEFITMLADHRIHDFTHGEPWKFMAFKIVLIAGLLPLHHWLEEKVIHYLVHHKLLDASKISIKLPSLRKSKAAPVEIEEKVSDN